MVAPENPFATDSNPSVHQGLSDPVLPRTPILLEMFLAKESEVFAALATSPPVPDTVTQTPTAAAFRTAKVNCGAISIRSANQTIKSIWIMISAGEVIIFTLMLI